MPAVGNKTCICGKTVQAKGYLRHLGRCDKVKAAQSRTQGTIFAARVEDVDAIEDADDMDDEDMDDEDMDDEDMNEDGLLAKRARPAAQPIGGLGAIVPGACTTPAHSCTPLSAAGGFGGQGGVSGALSTTPVTNAAPHPQLQAAAACQRACDVVHSSDLVNHEADLPPSKIIGNPPG
ncbi:hypothetical protein T492DRAFT_860075 [Pavlovales sp. CCMP2436]|nr:hypothetical protein T492DRAFT_860075 [Pavlovales sp. CCMP2436]